MGYLILTGATGLLGSYLMRDLLRAGTKLAVIVRPTKFAAARHRVETALARAEKQAGHSLPRPVVLQGDLFSPTLGLDEAALRWVADNCEAMFHNAASLTFHHAESRDEEPWRTNYGGTQNVLEFCRRTGIRKLHFVSTGYLHGMRSGRVYEHEVDVGQEHCNHYTFSKCEAEKLVHQADFLDAPTVYRPGIIIGDSQTGYTSTYHGFYVPLKLVSTFISRVGMPGTSREFLAEIVRSTSQRLRDVLSLEGHERKYYVPVDWIAGAMSRIYSRPQHHGKIFHLTSTRPVLVRVMQDVMEEAFLTYSQLKRAQPGREIAVEEIDWGSLEQMFIEGMSIYRSYWRDDPEFDCTNTEAALPDFPCPEVDARMLMMMCRFAIESNFGWPREPVVVPEFDVHDRLQPLSAASKSLSGKGDRHPSSTDAPAGSQQPGASPLFRTGSGGQADGRVFVGLQVNGRGGGQWELEMEQGQVVAAVPGLTRRCTATYYLNTKTFERLARSETTVEQAIGTGNVLIEGNGVPLGELARALQHVAGQT